MILKELTNQEFINFTDTYKLKSIYQTPEYGFIMNKQDYDSIILGLVDKDIVAASLILIKKEKGFKYAYAPKGFLLDYNNYQLVNEFSQQIKKYLSKKGIMGIKINPMIIKSIYKYDKYEEEKNQNYNMLFHQLLLSKYYHLGYNNFFESLNPRFEAIIDLNKPIETLFNNVKKSFRTKIRTCYKNGIRLYKGDSKDIHELEIFTNRKYKFNSSYFRDCYDYYSKRNMVDLYYTKLDTQVYLKNIQDKLNYYEEQSEQLNNEILIKHINNDNTIKRKINTENYLSQYKNNLIEAINMIRNNPDGIITSAVAVIKQDKEVTLLIDSYDKRYKKTNSKHLLIWQLIEIYKKQGYTKFNLGGLTAIIDNNKYSGLNDFKLSFGADIIEYAGDFELITNRRNYELYRNFYPIRKLMK